MFLTFQNKGYDDWDVSLFPCPLSGAVTEPKATGANGYLFRTLPMPNSNLQ